MSHHVTSYTIWMVVVAAGFATGSGEEAVTPRRYGRCVFDGTTGVKNDPVVARAVTGTVIFSEVTSGVEVDVDLEGFFAEDVGFRHGFHIHHGNGTGNACKDAKGHLNPKQVSHGHPWDKVRHVGDMGNVEVIPTHDGLGIIRTTFVDPVIRLDDSDHGIFNRVIQLHANEDDYGRSNATESASNGNSGPRQACCKILEVTAEDIGVGGATQTRYNAAVVAVFCLLRYALQ